MRRAFQICCRQAPTCLRLGALAMALPRGDCMHSCVCRECTDMMLLCRLHRIVDASIFYLSARSAAQMYNKPGLAVFISVGSRWASAVQLLALAITLFAPKFSVRNHETLKVSLSSVLFDTAPFKAMQCLRMQRKSVSCHFYDKCRPLAPDSPWACAEALGACMSAANHVQ